MKKIFYPAILLLLVFMLSNCGSDSTLTPVNPTATPTTTVASDAEIFAGKVYDVTNASKASALVVNTDYSYVTASSLNSSDTIVIPPTPSATPVIPSGSPNYSKTSTYGTVFIATVDWYYYIRGLQSDWLEWKETDTYQGVTVDNGYGQISQPTPQTGSSNITRTFTSSRWTQNNTKLFVYSTGSGSYNTGEPKNISFTGTQVIYLPKEINSKDKIACNFSCSSSSSGALSGNLTFENGSGTFNRTAPDTGAIGTANQYCQTNSSVNITSPVNKSANFTHTVYGNGSMKTVNTAGNIVNTMNYNGDTSGNGTITGIAQTSIALTWDSTGNGTATITAGQQTKTITIYVPYPFTPLLPSP